MLELRTLGELALYRDGQRIRLRAKKQQALLVFLTAHAGKSLRRDRLACLLWGGWPTEKARHSLSQALYQLRSQIPDLPIESSGDEIILLHGTIQADFVAFRAACQMERFREGIRLYSGDFLQGFWVPDAREFEEWQEAEREMFRQLASHALLRVLREEEGAGNWLQTEILAARLLGLDPFHEEAHRIRIQAIVANGDRRRAMQTWKHVRQIYQRELGYLPRHLADAIEPILQAQTIAILPDIEQEYGDSEPTRFVGRREEFRRLREAWEATKTGRGIRVIVSGEAGIGKTRLCRRLLRLAAIQGARCFTGRCYSSECQVPYSGFIDAIEGALRPEDFTSIPPPWIGELANLFPDLITHRGTERGSLEGARRRLFEAVLQLFRAICRNNPVVVFIDDFQWADDSTTALVHYLGRQLADYPIMIIVALRREDVRRRSMLGRLVGMPTTTGDVHRLQLTELQREEINELIAAFAERNDVSIPDQLKWELIDRVGGRPFFLIELLRAYRRVILTGV